MPWPTPNSVAIVAQEAPWARSEAILAASTTTLGRKVKLPCSGLRGVAHEAFAFFAPIVGEVPRLLLTLLCMPLAVFPQPLLTPHAPL